MVLLQWGKFLEKMTYANNADPDQTEGAVWSGYTLFAKYFKKQLHKKQKLGPPPTPSQKKVWNKVFKILR